MNLYTPGTGLFDTHVTWEDVEGDMQRELDTVASFGPRKAARNIGSGKGFMSRVLLVEPDWQSEDKPLPKQFVIKIVTQLAIHGLAKQMTEKNGIKNVFENEDFMVDFEQNQKILHNVEVNLHTQLQKLPCGKFPSPKIYYMKKFSESNPLKGYIIMEYMDDIKVINIYENVPLKALREAIHAIAVMEAASLKFNSAEKQELSRNFFSELYGQILAGEKLEAAVESLKMSCNGRFKDKVNKIEMRIDDIVDFAWADQLADEMGMQRVACHGDLWSANLLWRQDSSGDFHLAAIIDFQTAHMGCAAGDLARLFSSCLSGKERRQHWEELIKEFYGYLKEEVGDGKMPYTLDQLIESYKRFVPLAFFLIVTAIQPAYELQDDSIDHDKNKDHEAVVEKIECLLDDIIFYEERNLEHKKVNQSNKKFC